MPSTASGMKPGANASVGQPAADHAWKRIDPGEHVTPEGADRSGIRIGGLGERHLEREEVGGIESEVLILKTLQRATQQAGADEEWNGDRDLSGDERSAKPAGAPGGEVMSRPSP